MAHSIDCTNAARFIEAFILSRPAKFITTPELLLIYQYFNPCMECQVKPHMTSTLTGRLYYPIWTEHVIKCLGPIPIQMDLLND